MSFWVRRRDRQGRRSVYSVSIPFLPGIILAVLGLLALLVFSTVLRLFGL
jgi:hypothetical protein